MAVAALTVLAVAARSLDYFVGVDETAGAAAAAVAFLVVVSQLVNHPPAATEADIEVGAWLALAGTLLMFLGALMSRSGVSLAVVTDDSDRSSPSEATEGRTVPLPEERR